MSEGHFPFPDRPVLQPGDPPVQNEILHDTVGHVSMKKNRFSLSPGCDHCISCFSFLIPVVSRYKQLGIRKEYFTEPSRIGEKSFFNITVYAAPDEETIGPLHKNSGDEVPRLYCQKGIL